jgi:hypothetical protein
MTPAGRNLRSLGVIFAVAGLIGLLFGAAVPAIAHAASGQRVEIDLGSGFTTDPHGTVLDTSRLAPGSSVSGTLGVRSDFAGTSDLNLKFVDITAQNGCAPAQLADGEPCGQGSGQLDDQLVFNVDVGDSRDGAFTPAWSGHAAELEDGVSVPGEVQESQPRWVKLSATLPYSSGNETQNDRFGFGLQVTLTSASGAEAVTVKKNPSTPDRIGLAATGASIALLGVAALLLIGCGLIALMSGRSRPGRHFPHPSGGPCPVWLTASPARGALPSPRRAGSDDDAASRPASLGDLRRG